MSPTARPLRQRRTPPLDLDQIAADITASEHFTSYEARHRVCTIHAPRMLALLVELTGTEQS